MDNGVKSKLSKCADDTKLGSKVDSRGDGDQIQESIDTCIDWGKDWQMEFNLNKCKVLGMGKNNDNENRDYRMQGVILERVTQEKDLGMVIDMAGKQAVPGSYLKSKSGFWLYSEWDHLYIKRGGVNIVQEFNEGHI